MTSSQHERAPDAQEAARQEADMIRVLSRRRRWSRAADAQTVRVQEDIGETDMSDSGKKDVRKREQQKKAKLSLKEKRQLKREKKK